MLVCTAQQMREIDRRAIKEYAIPSIDLMERAGRSVVEVINTTAGELLGKAIAILCGRGNNGGDGFVIARHLATQGAVVTVYLLSNSEALRGDALTNFSALKGIALSVVELGDVSALNKHRDALAHSEIVVDAMLGTGQKGELGDPYRSVIEAVNSTSCLRFAVDIPTGIESDSGKALGVAFRADHTVTFALPKVALVSFPGMECVGRLHVVDIGIPNEAIDDAVCAARLLDDCDISKRLRIRPRWGHKGTFGHLLVLAGSPGKSGAALLVAEAALRTGCGLCTLSAPQSIQNALEAKTREVMLSIPSLPNDLCDDSDATFEALENILVGKKALAIGPGMVTSQGAERFLRRLIAEIDIPMVIDAEALNQLQPSFDALQERSARNVVLTPHPGEMARLTGLSIGDIQADRLGAATTLANRLGVVVVLKGARTLVAPPNGLPSINPTGNSGMGSAGMGDVLTGMIGSFLAQGYGVEDASICGVYLHGLAGDRAAHERGFVGLLASDLIDAIPLARKTIE